jgi:hypothetical protein
MKGSDATKKFAALWRRRVRGFAEWWAKERAKQLGYIRHTDKFLSQLKHYRPRDIDGFRKAVLTVKKKLRRVGPLLGWRKR